jgi:hypothetical protein
MLRRHEFKVAQFMEIGHGAGTPPPGPLNRIIFYVVKPMKIPFNVYWMWSFSEISNLTSWAEQRKLHRMCEW